jgi:hypothetical protein
MTRQFSEYVDLRDQQEYELLKAEILREVEEAAPAGARGLSGEDVEKGLDAAKLALDVWGLEPTTGWIGDLSSAGISTLQAVYKWFQNKPEEARSHGLDAGISLVSTIPFADFVKLAKARKGAKAARGVLKVARPVKGAIGAAKAARVSQRAGQFGLPVPVRAQQAAAKYGPPPRQLV